MTDKPWWLIGTARPVIGFSIDGGKRVDFEFGESQTKLGWADVSWKGHIASCGVWPRMLTDEELAHLAECFDRGCQCVLCIEGRRK